MIYAFPPEARKTSAWYDATVVEVPEGEAVHAQGRDGGGLYKLPFKIIRDGDGVYHAVSGKQIHIPIALWSRSGANE